MSAKPRTLEFMLGVPSGIPFTVDWSPFFDGSRGQGASVWVTTGTGHAMLLSHGGKVPHKPLEFLSYDRPEGHWGSNTPVTLENVWVIDFSRPREPILGMTEEELDGLNWLGFEV